MTLSETEDPALGLREQGYAILKGVLRPCLCDTLLEHVRVTTEAADKEGRRDLFGNIQEAENRWDLKLDLHAPVLEALNAFAARCGPHLVSFMGSESIKFVELAAITSDKGAKSQAVHADTMHGVTRYLQSDLDLPVREALSEDEDADADVANIMNAVANDTAIICTALAALQDIEEDMGPTHVWPGTNTAEHHATLWSAGIGGKLDISAADEAFKRDHVKMTLRKGDLVLYDSRTMHCGGPNQSKLRSVLVISTMSPGVRPDGTTWTMLPALRNKLRLRDCPYSTENAPAAAVAGAVTLPPPPAHSSPGAKRTLDETCEFKEIPSIEQWVAAVQCATCRQWRPVSVADAPAYANADRGFYCRLAGFSCMQPQKYTQKEIDDALS